MNEHDIRMKDYWRRTAFCNRIERMLLSKYKWDPDALLEELKPIVDKHWKKFEEIK